MRVAYTNYPLTLNRVRKHYGMKTRDEAYHFCMTRAVEQYNAQLDKMYADPIAFTSAWIPQELQDILTVTLQFMVEDSIDNGEAFHIFIPSIEFANWLVDCVKRCPPEDALMPLERMMRLKDGHKASCAVLHFPTTAGTPSVAFCLKPWATQTPVYKQAIHVDKILNANSIQDMMLFWPGHGNSIKNCVASLRIDEAGTPWLDALKNDQDMIWYVKLIVGISLYASAFPDAIMPHPPVGLVHPGHYTGTTHTLGIAPEVLQDTAHGTHASPVAHYRIGHFRILKSPRFVNKQFQTIFVHGTFVKGQAITVLSPEEQAEQQSSGGS